MGEKHITLFAILVVVSIFTSALPILTYSASGTVYQPQTNIYINGVFTINESTIDPLTGLPGQYGVRGNLIVNSTGTLIIDNATLYFDQDILHHFRMFVNGSLIMHNAKITVNTGSLQPYLLFNASFYGANVKIYDSKFQFPGNVYFYDSNVIMVNSQFVGISNATSIFGYNLYSFAPTPYFSGTDVYLYNDYFRDMFSPTPITEAYVGNLSSSPSSLNFTGAARFTPISTILPYPSNLMVNQIVLAIQYESGSPSNVSLFIAKNKTANATLASTGGKIQTYYATMPFPTLYQLNQIENNMYAIIYQNNSRSYTHILSLYFGVQTNDTFDYYGGSSNFYINFVNSVAYGRNVYFDVNYNNYTIDQGKMKNPLKNALNLINSNIYILNLTVSNSTITPQINQDPPFLVDDNSNVAIYRYIELSLTNYQNYPINHFDAIFYPNEGNPSANGLATSLNNLLYTNLQSVGILPRNFNYTMNGIAMVPVLTDIFNYETYPNTNVFGHYILDSEGIYANVTLPSFPALNNVSNIRLINIKTNDTFIFYKLAGYSEPVFGSNFNIDLNVSSYGNNIYGNFIILNKGAEFYASPTIHIRGNTSNTVILTVYDSLNPGPYNLTLEFISNVTFSSNMPITLNITSHSNVSVIVSGYIKPKYSMGGAWISGFPATLFINVTNTGSQSTGTFLVKTQINYPNGSKLSNNFTLELSGHGTFAYSQQINISKINSPSTVEIISQAILASNIYPKSTAGSNFTMNEQVIPAPTLTINGIQIEGTPYAGIPIDGMVSLSTNEQLENIAIEYSVNNFNGSLYIGQVSGEENIPFEISANETHVGYNLISFYYNNQTTPYIQGHIEYSENIYVNPNYGFKVIQSPFLLSGNITNYINGTDLLYVESIGVNYSSYVPGEAYESGSLIFSGNISTDTNYPVPISIPYMDNMTLAYYFNYNDQLSSSQGILSYFYTLPIPYFSVVNNLPTTLENGTTLSGNIVLNSVYNFPSLNTTLQIKLGGYTLLSEYLGNLSIGQGTVIPVNVNTTSLAGLMDGNNYVSYPVIITIGTSTIKPYFINLYVGNVSIYERVNFAVTNISVSPSQIFEGEPFNVSFVVENDGGSYFSGYVPYRIVVLAPGPILLYQSNLTLSLYPNQNAVFTTPQLSYSKPIIGILQVYLNYNHKIFTKLQFPENISVPLSVLVPKITFTYSVTNPSPTVGQNIVLILRSTNSIINKPWPANFSLIITSGGKTIYTYSGATSSSGVSVITFRATISGNYNMEIINDLTQTPQTYTYTNFIKVKTAPLVVPIYVYPIIIIGALLAAFAIGTFYVRNKTSNLMQCSVCGALIPADSLKCPRCGTEFEKDMVKCSECSSWIPEDSKYCPNCGAIFLSKKDPEYETLTKLKADYDKFVDNYRQKARIIFGEKMSENEFQKWWKSNPDYKGFKEWLIDKGVSPDLSNAINVSSKNKGSRFKLFKK